ncbi:MAG: hypothetical protein ACRD1H_07100, partial [Vicinamibacterales bacterium]
RDDRQRDHIRLLRIARGAGWGTPRMFRVEADRQRDSSDLPLTGPRGLEREPCYVMVDSADGGLTFGGPFSMRDELEV